MLVTSLIKNRITSSDNAARENISMRQKHNIILFENYNLVRFMVRVQILIENTKSNYAILFLLALIVNIFDGSFLC